MEVWKHKQGGELRQYEPMDLFQMSNTSLAHVYASVRRMRMMMIDHPVCYECLVLQLSCVGQLVMAC